MPVMPIYEPAELVTLALMLVALGVTLAHWPHVKKWRFARLACLWFVLRLAASVFTVAEGQFWSAGFNLMEHLCYAVGAVVALWALVDFGRYGRTELS